MKCPKCEIEADDGQFEACIMKRGYCPYCFCAPSDAQMELLKGVPPNETDHGQDVTLWKFYNALDPGKYEGTVYGFPAGCGLRQLGRATLLDRLGPNVPLPADLSSCFKGGDTPFVI